MCTIFLSIQSGSTGPEKCKHIFSLTHYVNIEGHSKTSHHCEWNAPKISKAGKDLYCKGKIIEEWFPLKNPLAI